MATEFSEHFRKVRNRFCVVSGVGIIFVMAEPSDTGQIAMLAIAGLPHDVAAFLVAASLSIAFLVQLLPRLREEWPVLLGGDSSLEERIRQALNKLAEAERAAVEFAKTLDDLERLQKDFEKSAPQLQAAIKRLSEEFELGEGKVRNADAKISLQRIGEELAVSADTHKRFVKVTQPGRRYAHYVRRSGGFLYDLQRQVALVRIRLVFEFVAAPVALVLFCVAFLSRFDFLNAAESFFRLYLNTPVN